MVKRIGEKGFTLIEIMIAMTIFALFTTAFLMSQGTNISNSTLMQEDLILHSLAQRKINEVLIDKPVFTNATENDVESKNFEEKDYKKYKYTIEYKKLKFPNFQQLIGTSEEDENAQDPNQAIKKMVFDKLKKNVEEMLWQVKVTVTNTETNYSFELSSWIRNDDAQVDVNFGF
jgi:type II secretion system protein I